MIYLIGSLGNPAVVDIENTLRAKGYDAFAQWHAAGPEADSHWQRYAKRRGLGYREALSLEFVEHAFEFDWQRLLQAEVGVLIMPAGKSACLELGWLIGKGRLGFVLFDGEPERYDLMFKMATNVVFSAEELVGQFELFEVRKGLPKGGE